jgi:flagellar biosynthesis/type III secretory pathway protein FliH
LSFEIASRLTANASMERAPFVAAVQEALMRLPRPGENLYLRLRAEEVESWKKIVDDPGLPFNCTILVDADVRPGHAYVEVSGARIDVGQEARLALVRHALGLDGTAEIKSTADALPQSDTQLLSSPSTALPALDPDPLADALDPPPAEKE